MKAETVALLTEAASRLSAESDLMNEAIRDFEDELRAAGAGVTAWLELSLFPSDGSGWNIGFQRSGGEWHVVACREAADTRAKVGPLVTLLKAPRAVRIEAVTYLDELARAVTSKMLEYADRIAQSRNSRKEGVT